MRDLARAMLDDPERLLPVLVESAMDQCDAVSGGISLYEPEPAPGLFRWHHLRGELERFTGTTTPRFYSPCGITLDQRRPILVDRPERAYEWLQEANVSLPECLLVPLYRGGDELLGTLWLVSNDQGHFDANHAEIATEMASFVGLALRMADHDSKLGAALERQEMLAREMSHRLQNVLAVVQALLNMAAEREGTAEELARAMGGTLRALGAAHNVVRAAPDEPPSARGSALADLVRTILQPYRARTISVRGPEICLGREATSMLALVLHELATNAAKHGAFSSIDGKIDVTWQTESHTLNLQWKESGGPIVKGEPKTSGFGSLLAHKSICALRGDLQRVWDPGGLCVNVRLPLETLAL